MLANPPVPQASFWLRPKYALFAFVGVMTAYVLAHNERFLIEPLGAYVQWLEEGPMLGDLVNQYQERRVAR
jgi:hypothetical protein